MLFKLKPITVNKVLSWMERKFTMQLDAICDTDLPDFIQNDCGETEYAGIVALGFIYPGTHVGENNNERRANLEDPTWWTDGQDASPQTHWVVIKTQGDKPAGTPVESDGFGLNAVSFEGSDMEANFKALGYLDNYDFWSGVNKRQGWGLVTVSKGTGPQGRIGSYHPDANINADVVIDQSIKNRIRIEGKAKWTTDGTISLPFTAPASIFTP